MRSMLPVVIAACALGTSATARTGAAIPPDADGALQALLDSPRHGEWIDVPVARSEAVPDADRTDTVRTWVVYPERADAAPVVMVVHEIMGMTDWVRAVADRLAGEGFIAVAPDLLSGKGPDGGGTESFAGDRVREAIRALTPEEVARRLDAVREWAIARPAARDRSACIGFCWGGSTSFRYATFQPGLQAAVVFYGTAPSEQEALARIACPVLGLYGGDDARVTSTVDGTTATMRALGKPFAAKVYAGAGHGFLRRQSGRDGANEKAARAAWRETVTFLRAKLEAAPGGDAGRAADGKSR